MIHYTATPVKQEQDTKKRKNPVKRWRQYTASNAVGVYGLVNYFRLFNLPLRL